MATTILDRPFAAYEAGTPLRDVTLAEARAMECNRCGDCCNGLSEYVKKDEQSGLPLFVWGSKFPDDLYESRYGERLLQPIATLDGGIGLADEFDTNDGLPHTAFKCSKWVAPDPGSCVSSCALLLAHPQPDPSDISKIRPRNCGEFPVFGLDVDATIIDGHSFVPATGALPRCTWHGIRVTGPWKNEPYWESRWERQQRGEEVEPVLSVEEAFGKMIRIKGGQADGEEV